MFASFAAAAAAVGLMWAIHNYNTKEFSGGQLFANKDIGLLFRYIRHGFSKIGWESAIYHASSQLENSFYGALVAYTACIECLYPKFATASYVADFTGNTCLFWLENNMWGDYTSNLIAKHALNVLAKYCLQAWEVQCKWSVIASLGCKWQCLLSSYKENSFYRFVISINMTEVVEPFNYVQRLLV